MNKKLKIYRAEFEEACFSTNKGFTKNISLSTEGITRLEVIDHHGRQFMYHSNNVSMKLDIQDEGRTLKIFISPK